MVQKASQSTPPTTDSGFRCLECGYNLTGLLGSICPECGREVDWARISELAHSEHQSGRRVLVGLLAFVVGGVSLIGGAAAILTARPWTVAFGVTTLATALLLFVYAEWVARWRILTPQRRSFLMAASLWIAIVQIGCGTCFAIWRMDANVLECLLLSAPGLVLLVVRLAPRVYGYQAVK